MSKPSKKKIIRVMRIHQKILERHNRLLNDLVTQVNSLTDALNAEKQ